ncbi:hypothetical protein L7F22_036115 [Adiantum nelumboides]|nr:hypothetical protein [Adiantum nelumboides]
MEEEEGFRGTGAHRLRSAINDNSANGGSGRRPGTVEAAAGGWSLGLQLHVMNRLTSSSEQLLTLLHYRRRGQQQQAAGNSPFFLSTPSISSSSSSDLDTESTGSFFPERSTTLGTLIGIHSRPGHRHIIHIERPAALRDVISQLLHSKAHYHFKAASHRLQACCCTALTLVIRCASCRSHDPHAPSHEASLAHLLELERQQAAAHPPETEWAPSPFESFDQDLSFEDCSHPNSALNTHFNDNGTILPPQPSGAPLQVALHQLSTSPTISSYPSADWSVSAAPTIPRMNVGCNQF